MHEGLADGTTDPVNRKPTAAAGADQSVEGPASVSLDGSASKDSSGTIASPCLVTSKRNGSNSG